LTASAKCVALPSNQPGMSRLAMHVVRHCLLEASISNSPEARMPLSSTCTQHVVQRRVVTLAVALTAYSCKASLP
jgi:hypothetical protein